MLRKLFALSGHIEDRIWHVSWSKNGKFIASCGEDKVVRIWTTKTGQWAINEVICIATLEDAQSRTIRCCEWSIDGFSLACASFDGTIAIWEAQNNVFSSWELMTTLEGHESEVKGVSWSNDGKWLASCGRDKTVWIWEKFDQNEYECVALLQGKQGHSQDVKSIIWHPCISLLFSASYDDTIKVWREENGDWYCSETLAGHKSTVWGVSFDNNGEKLISISDDKSIIIWQCLDTQQYAKWNKIGTLLDCHKYPIYT